MNSRPQTIQIFLPSGDPQGIRIAEITTRIVQAVDVPRSRIAEFLEMRESERLSLYILVGEDDDGAGKLAYIGQSGDLRKRLATHNNERDFWQRALVLSTRTESLTQSHVLFLENLLIHEAKAAGRFRTENCNNGMRSHVPEPLMADCHEIFDTARTLIASLGCPIFERIGNSRIAADKQEYFFCKRSNTSATGVYTDEGFVVLRGSVGKADVGRGFQTHSFSRLRDDLLQQQKIVLENGALIFKDDVLFSSPSGASAVVCGTTCNGWLDWKNERGVTLHELKRKDAAETQSGFFAVAA